MNCRGMVIIVAAWVTAFLTVVGASVLMRSSHEASLGRRSASRQAAFYMADAGIEQAARNLATPTDAGDDTTTMNLTGGSFTIDAPASVGTLLYQATVHGASGSEQRDVEAVFLLTPKSVFQFALFGDQRVNVLGDAITDSYDSRLGAYNVGGNIGHNGDVGTNATTAGGVTVGGSIFIDGQAAVGAGASNPTSLVTGYNPAFITGGTSPPSDTQDVVAQSRSFPMPDVTIPGGCTTTLPPLSGGVRTFQTGTAYCPNGDLTVNGNETLTASGPGVKIYLSGELKINGNATVGVASNPSWMAFLIGATGGATLEGSISGSTDVYAAIYAPNATIDISGNAKIFGSVIADTVNITGNAQVHYDEATSTLTDIGNLYTTALKSWRELN